MKNKLLAKAMECGRSVPKRGEVIPITKDEVGLVVALLQSKITTRQYASALNKKDAGFATHRVTAVLKFAVSKNWVELRQK